MDNFVSEWPGPLSGPSHLLQPWVEDAEVRPLVVFFGAKDLLEEQFNFPSLGRGVPAHRLFLNNGSNSWYQGGIPQFAKDFQACSDLIQRWADVLEANEICCVGTSMGAYGAILHGARLGARVLAFSVDHMIASPGSQSERHYDGPCPVPYPELSHVVSGAKKGCTVQLISGERDIADLYSTYKLADLAGISACSVIGADHYVPSCLSRRNHLNRILQGFVKGAKLEIPMLGSALNHPGYIENVFKAKLLLDEGKFERAREMARSGQDEIIDGEAANLTLAKALQKLGRHEEAINIFSRALVTAPGEVKTLSLLAQSLRRTGRLVSARAVHEYILLLAPGHHSSNYALALINHKEGQIQKAYAEIKRALNVAPNNKAYRERLAIIQKNLKPLGNPKIENP